jgi:D-serine deaminase-like pyridoxal phosphate-dependent protein
VRHLPEAEGERLDAATAGLDPPFAVVDLDAFDANAADLLRRAGGVPVRLASKSVRVRALVERALEAGLRGILAFTLPEALWLAGHGHRDVLVAYPTADRRALRELTGSPAREAVTVMVDCAEHLDLIRAAGATAEAPVRVCIDVDAGWRPLGGRVRIGAQRAPLRFVNGGGTGSVERTAAEPAVTEVAAGSGLFAPTLFDAYRAFTPRPAALFALPVVRRPSAEVATVLGGGYLASGAAGADRLPSPVLPPGLRLDHREGAGEVQTPVTGEAARQLRVGDRVWFRHAKAGELCERFDAVHLVRGREVVDTVPTYRGEGCAFL